MTRLVSIEAAGPVHPIDYNLIKHPPEGYEFFVGSPRYDNLMRQLVRRHIFEKAVRGSARVLPLSLVKAYIDGLRTRNCDFDLIYAVNHVVFKSVPWVVFVEWAHFLAGFHVRVLAKYRKVVEDALSSEHCGAILTKAEIVKWNVLSSMDCDRFEDKIEVIYPGIPRRQFVKEKEDDKVKILFIGSGRTPTVGDFHTKGGKEVVEMFAVLSKEYNNLELVLRAKVPRNIRSAVKGQQNIKLLEKPVPRDLLEIEFKSADILVHPTHFPLNNVVLDGMSYELPVVAPAVYNYPEWIENGVTGFLIEPAGDIPYYWENFTPPGPTPLGPEFNRRIKRVSQETVRRLVNVVSILIEDENLRRRVGRSARWEIEEGKFCIRNRNRNLRKVFERAIR